MARCRPSCQKLLFKTFLDLRFPKSLNFKTRCNSHIKENPLPFAAFLTTDNIDSKPLYLPYFSSLGTWVPVELDMIFSVSLHVWWSTLSGYRIQFLTKQTFSWMQGGAKCKKKKSFRKHGCQTQSLSYLLQQLLSNKIFFQNYSGRWLSVSETWTFSFWQPIFFFNQVPFRLPPHSLHVNQLALQHQTQILSEKEKVLLWPSVMCQSSSRYDIQDTSAHVIRHKLTFKSCKANTKKEMTARDFWWSILRDVFRQHITRKGMPQRLHRRKYSQAKYRDVYHSTLSNTHGKTRISMTNIYMINICPFWKKTQVNKAPRILWQSVFVHLVKGEKIPQMIFPSPSKFAKFIVVKHALLLHDFQILFQFVAILIWWCQGKSSSWLHSWRGASRHSQFYIDLTTVSCYSFLAIVCQLQNSAHRKCAPANKKKLRSCAQRGRKISTRGSIQISLLQKRTRKDCVGFLQYVIDYESSLCGLALKVWQQEIPPPQQSLGVKKFTKTAAAAEGFGNAWTEERLERRTQDCTR